MSRMSSNPSAKYNVIVVTCTVNGEQYIGARMKDEQDFRVRVNKAAEGDVEQTALVQSVRKYGDSKHVYVLYRDGLSYNQARKLKAELVAKSAVKGKLLMHQLLRGRGLATAGFGKLVYEPSVKIKKAQKKVAKQTAQAAA